VPEPRPLGRVEFGGPDLPPRRLRDLLQEHVENSPPGSRIDWATYYFRDRALAQALMAASDRGVRVRLVLESEPRLTSANEAVIKMLRRHGLGGGFRLYDPGPIKPGHIHAKIYAFSHPDVAWVGSFNPSGDEPDDAGVICEIGDQDRGHNLLLGIERPRLTAALRRHVGILGRWWPLHLKTGPHFNLPVSDAGTRLYFYPRLWPHPAEREIARIGAGGRVRGAISHLKEGRLTGELRQALSGGTAVDLLVHDTERRVPSELVRDLTSNGVNIVRVSDPEGLPMHAKFLLIERGGTTNAWLGSHNFNAKSEKKNAELLLKTSDAGVIAALSRRFDQIAAMARST
jgi:hypothetical protein